MTVKLKSVKPFLTNTEMPLHLPDCYRGQYIEQLFIDNGFEINRGKGADLPGIKTDIKSRKIESRSAHSITVCTESHIIKNSYQTSNVYPKFQHWTQPIYSDTFKEIISHKNYDFTKAEVQKRIEEGYNGCRDQLIAGVDPTQNYIRHKCIIFERVKSRKDSWDIRLPHGEMQKVIALSGSSFDSMFTVI
jgi:hypothetical protein